MVLLSIVAAFLVPICLGCLVHYLAFVRTVGRRPVVCEALGWIVTMTSAFVLFPRSWRNMELVSLACFVWYAVFQITASLALQPVARWLGRRKLTGGSSLTRR